MPRVPSRMSAFVVQYAMQISHYGVIQGLSIHANDVQTIQRPLQEFLQQIKPPVAIAHVVAAYASAFESGGKLSLITQQPGLGGVVQAVSALLLEAGPRLGRCTTPTCQRLFVGTKVSQQRCRANCGVTERVRAWRKENPDRVSEGRHKRYVHKVKTRLPGARVTRRKKGA